MTGGGASVPALGARSRLAVRFLLACALLVAATVACGVWSVYTFVQLSRSVGATLRDSETTLDLTATLASDLEREDDGLLLVLSGADEAARHDLQTQRRRFDDTFARLANLLSEADERAAARALRRHVDTYRAEGDTLARTGDPGTALRQYHERVNPILRRAVAECAEIREHNFRSMRLAGVRARDQANRAGRIVAAVLLGALVVSVVVALYLARSVVRPVLALTESVDAVGRGDFTRRLRVSGRDELGRLAEGFNQMADSLEELRRFDLGEVLRAKRTLEATLEALPDAIVVLGPGGGVESMNRPARELLLSPGAEALRGPLEALPLAPSARDAIEAALRHPSPAGGGRPVDLSGAVRYERRGSGRKLLPIAVPLPDFAPDARGAIVVLYDVTDFARLDELRGEVVAVASHELRTPLTTIRMNLMLLEEHLENMSLQQKEIVSTALLGCTELETIIQRLLDVASIEAGQLRLVRGPTDMGALVSETASRFRDRAVEVGIGLELPGRAEAVMANVDAARMAIVISNLVSNALKYTPPGGSIDISVARVHGARTGAPQALQIQVTDTGPGVPAELRERVFDKFFRVEHVRPRWSEGVRGAGLGLYLCRQIVEAHGGNIRAAEGQEGRGMRVVIELPASGFPAE